MKRRFFALFAALVLLFPAGQAQSGAAVMKFSELYSRVTVRGIEFSPKLTGLAGRTSP